MAIANIANIPGDWESLQEWSFAHMAHHRDLNAYIQRTKNVNLPLYQLDPMNLDDLGTFANQHQIMHNNQNAILNIQGNDLTDVDWNDQTQRSVWTFLNFTEHLRANAITGVG